MKVGVQVIVAAHGRTRAYDIRNGEVLWSLSGLGLNVIPTPIYDSSILYLASGKRDGNMIQVVDLSGAKGDLDGSAALLWTPGPGHALRVHSPPLPRSALLLQARPQLPDLRGCCDRPDPLHGARGPGQRLRFSGGRRRADLPVGPGGKGKGAHQGPALEVLAENVLDDGFDASPAIVGGDLYLRGRRFLYALSRSVRD